MDWIAFWTAFAAIGTVGALLVLFIQLWVLRRDRRNDYLRALIPFVSIDLHDERQGIGRIPVRVHAHGGGVAYNVIINLKSSVLPIPAIADVIPTLREGASADTVLLGSFSVGFLGELEIGFIDVFGKRHEAWHTVNCASGPLKPTDWLHWRCKSCRVHPTDATQSGLISRLRARFRK